MRFAVALTAVSCLILEVVALPFSPETHIVHERKAEHIGRSWTRVEKAPGKAKLPMRIGLKQSNLQVGHELLMNISSPNSPHYGKHLQAHEIIDLFAPPESSVQAVRDWLVSSGIPAEDIEHTANKQWLAFDAEVDTVEKILFTDYHIYEHIKTGIQNVGCEHYHVPKEIQGHIDYITPGIKLNAHGYDEKAYARARRRRGLISGVKRGGSPPRLRLNGGCDRYVTPACIKDQYMMEDGTKAHPKNKLGVFQGLTQHYSQADMDTYFYNVYPDIPNGTHPELRAINGAFGPTEKQSEAGTEADLDFQAVYPLIWPQGAVLWQTDDEWYQKNQTDQHTPFKGYFNTLWDAMDGSYCTFSAFNETGNCVREECLDPFYPNPQPGGYKGELMCGVYEPTTVISISYSGAEIDLPYSYQQRQCVEIMKLGLQGTTVVVSSGDDGVGGFEGDPTESGCLGPKETVFNPQFIVNCPYVLAVGSTVLSNDTARREPNAKARFVEAATRRFRSGGGFSNIFPTADYQTTHVARYLATAGLDFDGYEGGGTNYSNVGVAPGLFNKLGRGYPDVSAIGDNFVMVNRGEIMRVGGTSLSAPIVASMVTLLNEERLAANKSTVGFMQPVLYAHPEIFTDVTSGDNANCKSTGFLAKSGWDPLTGLGTPKYPELKKLFSSLP